MNSNHKPLMHLKNNQSARIKHIHGGLGLRKRLNSLGIREGQIVKLVSKQPLMGPLTISVGNTQMTIGRGMAHKILVEEI